MTSSESPSKVRVVTLSVSPKFVDVKDEMSFYVRAMATSQITMLPEMIWKNAKVEMDKRYGSLWTGHTKEFVKALIWRTRAQANYGDQFRQIESTHLRMTKDSNRPCLQFQGCFNIPEDSSRLARVMAFGNPALISLLMTPKLDLFFDGTFCMTPAPFYQTFILMVYDQQTKMYVPVLYFLMTHKLQHLYWHVFNWVVILSDWKLDVRSYTSDFEMAIVNAAKHQFPEGYHIGCFFHFKQAVRKHMIEKLYFHRAIVRKFMQIGVLDLLTIIPVDDIIPYRIPYLRDMMESDMTYLEEIYNADGLEYIEDVEKNMWEQFWAYFDKQWMGKLHDSWNIHDQDDHYKDYVNRTNNALESYNRCYQDLFPTCGHKVRLTEWVEITQQDSRYQAEQLEDIRRGRRKQPTHKGSAIPELPAEYLLFKELTQANENA